VSAFSWISHFIIMTEPRVKATLDDTGQGESGGLRPASLINLGTYDEIRTTGKAVPVLHDRSHTYECLFLPRRGANEHSHTQTAQDQDRRWTKEQSERVLQIVRESTEVLKMCPWLRRRDTTLCFGLRKRADAERWGYINVNLDLVGSGVIDPRRRRL